ncbi:SRPBCC family protein [Pseudonocardia sp. GCM10023141]|uniref:SRPBCC family protein n=1 Tax=Pseudonocardia sp. GCM10023141 TaxID=3252653 RepID=UPI00361D2B3F
MDTSKKLQASKVIKAPAEKIFALISDPSRHADIDGADMLRGVEGTSAPIGGIGQTFVMNMHADDLGDYRMVNHVTAYVPGSRVGWGPSLDPTCELAEKLGEMDASGHTYTYDLNEVEGGTEVTQTYEWMSVKDPKFAEMFPRVSQEQLAGSLDRIEAALT